MLKNSINWVRRYSFEENQEIPVCKENLSP